MIVTNVTYKVITTKMDPVGITNALAGNSYSRSLQDYVVLSEVLTSGIGAGGTNPTDQWHPTDLISISLDKLYADIMTWDEELTVDHDIAATGDVFYLSETVNPVKT